MPCAGGRARSPVTRARDRELREHGVDLVERRVDGRRAWPGLPSGTRTAPRDRPAPVLMRGSGRMSNGCVWLRSPSVEPHGVAARHHHRSVGAVQGSRSLAEHVRDAGQAAVPQEPVDAGLGRYPFDALVNVRSSRPLRVEKRQRHARAAADRAGGSARSRRSADSARRRDRACRSCRPAACTRQHAKDAGAGARVVDHARPGRPARGGRLRGHARRSRRRSAGARSRAAGTEVRLRRRACALPAAQPIVDLVEGRQVVEDPDRPAVGRHDHLDVLDRPGRRSARPGGCRRADASAPPSSNET